MILSGLFFQTKCMPCGHRGGGSGQGIALRALRCAAPGKSVGGHMCESRGLDKKIPDIAARDSHSCMKYLLLILSYLTGLLWLDDKLR